MLLLIINGCLVLLRRLRFQCGISRVYRMSNIEIFSWYFALRKRKNHSSYLIINSWFRWHMITVVESPKKRLFIVSTNILVLTINRRFFGDSTTVIICHRNQEFIIKYDEWFLRLRRAKYQEKISMLLIRYTLEMPHWKRSLRSNTKQPFIISKSITEVKSYQHESRPPMNPTSYNWTCLILIHYSDKNVNLHALFKLSVFNNWSCWFDMIC